MPADAARGAESRSVIDACNAAADELAASRKLIDALETENAALKQRLDTERHTTVLLGELNETRKSETEALRTALAAKTALTAKDAVIVSQNKLIETLKRKKSSTWKRIGDILIGVAVAAILK